jgi:hypothetical protein
MRPSSRFFIFILGCGLVLAILLLQGAHQIKKDRQGMQEAARLVEWLGLSDLCLFTEARYTRHLSLADLHAPFQDHPVSLEHFPSGSLVRPPRGIGKMP